MTGAGFIFACLLIEIRCYLHKHVFFSEQKFWVCKVKSFVLKQEALYQYTCRWILQITFEDENKVVCNKQDLQIKDMKKIKNI